jgi:hypothetical protein
MPFKTITASIGHYLKLQNNKIQHVVLLVFEGYARLRIKQKG